MARCWNSFPTILKAETGPDDRACPNVLPAAALCAVRLYRLNDERAQLKKAINLASGSRLFEEKSYVRTIRPKAETAHDDLA
jgi:hypothetical protein